jgi:CheY-like chemotaxis protein
MAKILIIDPEEPIRETLEAIACTAGHETRCAVNPNEGLEIYLAYQPDLVITDILTPEKEGSETISSLRKIRPDLPIVAISGGRREGCVDVLQLAERFGADRLLSKPFPAAAILRSIVNRPLTAPGSALGAFPQCPALTPVWFVGP